MHVLATAGHVDHGKSALVRALTGMEPDRWAEEHRRGLTIDLGYAWTTLPSGADVTFVDVPGHQRFIGNMLAGIGPAPAVVFVVAADEGWRQQSTAHLAAVDALGIRHGLLVVTRSDLADPRAALSSAGEQLGATSLSGCEAVAVSARTGDGMPAVRDALARLVAGLPAPVTDGRVRLWVDRSFTIKGAGTVVTGTLGEGTVRVGDELELLGPTTVGQVAVGRAVQVRGVQSLERARDSVAAVARVALNLRGVGADEVARGDALLTPGAWRPTSSVDVRLNADPRELPSHGVLHIGTTAIDVRLRPLAGDAVRLTLPHALPLCAGDRAILRFPGGERVVVGALLVDADPPALRRRGAGAQRGQALADATGVLDLVVEVGRRGAMQLAHAAALGLRFDGASVIDDVARGTSMTDANSVARHGDWLVSDGTWAAWGDKLSDIVRVHAATHPLEPALTLEAARMSAGIPDRALLLDLAAYLKMEVRDGRVGLQGVAARLSPTAEAALAGIESRLAANPFAAPERPDLDGSGLGPRQVAAAVRAGRLLRLRDDVLLLPTGPAQAMRVLAALPQPFTTSQAREALGSTRRVVIPLLEHLDSRGWTRRLDASHREVRSSAAPPERDARVSQ